LRSPGRGEAAMASTKSTEEIELDRLNQTGSRIGIP